MEKTACFVKITGGSFIAFLFQEPYVSFEAVRFLSGTAADKGVAVAYALETRQDRRAFTLIQRTD